jgi:hypothetical protein
MYSPSGALWSLMSTKPGAYDHMVGVPRLHTHVTAS